MQDLDNMFKGKQVMDTKEVMKFFLVGLMSGGSGLAPRRSLDYALMKSEIMRKIQIIIMRKASLLLINTRPLNNTVVWLLM